MSESRPNPSLLPRVLAGGTIVAVLAGVGAMLWPPAVPLVPAETARVVPRPSAPMSVAPAPVAPAARVSVASRTPLPARGAEPARAPQPPPPEGRASVQASPAPPPPETALLAAASAPIPALGESPAPAEARAVTQPAAPGPVARLDRLTHIVVRRGQSLWSIARSRYGRGDDYWAVYRANRVRIAHPGLIHAGQVFVLPALTRSGSADRAGTDAVVLPGQSLWRIAHRAYGAGRDYRGIYESNRARIARPDLIYPGQVLALPSRRAAR